ncbi:hypothetical protein O6H91_13G033900 [Diphasiastrum complanatum]|uniref:Uncharacterized protein n=1 Tax=Diphasiastrum complanatum TaxID=34168 RepID=A0ACC2BTP9_DIPCM|nr:hypothetical protein O6H91_13G033900 [Diphasiastrum complanatum]
MINIALCIYSAVKLKLIMQKIVIFFTLIQTFSVLGTADLEVGFYQDSCPNTEQIVRSTMEQHYSADLKIAPAILRLHFHDCFGCDGSVLISSSSSEKTSPFNAGLSGFEVIDDAKNRLESGCPGIVSCADILALAARDAVSLTGGPSWEVATGRRDGSVSSALDTFNLPTPFDSVAVLKQKFLAKGLSAQDLVTLTGAHTIGRAECRLVSYRLYNYTGKGDVDPSINTNFANILSMQCPRKGSGRNLIPMDTGSPDVFDSTFFFNVVQGNGVLESDQKILDDMSTRAYVRTYAGFDQAANSFESAFADAMQKMGGIEVKTGSEGNIRKVCSVLN